MPRMPSAADQLAAILPLGRLTGLRGESPDLSDGYCAAEVLPSSVDGFSWVRVVKDGEESWLKKPVRNDGLVELMSYLRIPHLVWTRELSASAYEGCPWGQKMKLDTTVYFIRQAGGVGPVKIGASVFPNFRLESLQTGCPVKLEIVATCPGGFELENELHRRFRAHRLHGEWFEPCDDLMDYIDRCRERP